MIRQSGCTARGLLLGMLLVGGLAAETEAPDAFWPWLPEYLHVASPSGERPEPPVEPFELLGEVVPAGEFRRLSWQDQHSFGGLDVSVPVLVAHGQRPGPVLCVTAAIHGDELNGIEIVRNLMFGIDIEALNGTVIGVPIVNIHGFQRNSRYLPDRRDLNRHFPGNATGSAASRIAHSFFQSIVLQCDALADLHTGSLLRTNLPQLRADLDTPAIRELTAGFGATVVLHSEGGSGTLRRAASDAGIPAVTLEVGEPMRFQPDEVSHGVRSLRSLMNHLGMDERASLWEEPRPIYYRSSWVRADSSGILASRVGLGDTVDQGELLGTVTDPITNRRSEIRSPYHGRILGKALGQAVMPGFAAYHIGIQASGVMAGLDETCGPGHDDACEQDADIGQDGPAERPAGADEPVEREVEPRGDDERLAELAADQRDFAFSLLERLAGDEDGNLFVSPYSIAAALAMVYAGADGETRRQMADTLHFPLEDDLLHPAFNRLEQALAARAEAAPDREGDAFRLDLINQAWGDETFDFQPDYLDLLARHYGAGMRPVDFRTAFEAVRQHINAWVADQTEQRIEDLLPPASLDADTRFVLTNAIHFLASWQQAFDADRTRDQPFTRPDGSTVSVPLMHQTARFGHHVDERTVAVSMPYVGDEVELVAMMPADASAGFEDWAARLDREHFEQVLESMDDRDVALHFPRFQSGYELQLAEVLGRMGMVDAFDACAADFRRITGVEPCIPDRSLFIDEVFHKSFVDIDEAGTEAAAATAVAMARVTSLGPEPVTVRFDRPFHYFIHDRPTGTVLFMGRMLDPSAQD